MHRSSVPILVALCALSAVAACNRSETHAAEPDYVPLFDGKSLEGWVTKGGRYDGDAAWTVEDGAIVGRTKDGHGGLLYTARPYTEFVLRL